MEKNNNPNFDTPKTERINKYRKDLADKMIPLFGAYKEAGGSYIFEPSLSKMKELLGYDTSHISRLLARPNFEKNNTNKVTENNYRSAIRLVNALVKQKKTLEEAKNEPDIDNFQKIIDEQKRRIKELEETKKDNTEKKADTNDLHLKKTVLAQKKKIKELEELKKLEKKKTDDKKRKSDAENLLRQKTINEQKAKIDSLEETKKPIISKESIEVLIFLIVCFMITIMGFTYLRKDIISYVDSVKYITEFNNDKEELIFHDGKVEARPIDTSNVYEYPDLSNDTIVFSKKGIKILRGKQDSLFE